jgi:hypothetical protein
LVPDGQLKVAGGDPLHLQILGGVAGQLQHLGQEEKTLREKNTGFEPLAFELE